MFGVHFPMTAGRIHSFESFGSVDGPGVRFVVFVQGCRMRCAYCHNPDTWKPDAPGTLVLEAKDVLERALRYREYWGDKGGITVSGGEPLLQMPFVTELFTLAKAAGATTALDTAAEPFSDDPAWLEAFRRLLAVTDTVLLDLKHSDPEGHRRLTGKPLKPVWDCARFLSDLGKPVWIRHVLVPGVTDGEKQLERLAAFIRTLANVERVEVLPYHDFALYKWEKLGIKNRLIGISPPPKSSVEAAKRILPFTQTQKTQCGCA